MLDRRRFGSCLIAIVLLSLAGCRKSPHGDRLPTYATAGRIVVGGQAAVGAEVQLWAVDGGLQSAGLCPHAIADNEGRFHLTTYATGDGAPAGQYAMTLRWPVPPPPGRERGPDRFQGRYADPARPLRIVWIVAGENELETIQLD